MFKGSERAVVPDRDRPESPGDGAQMPSQEPGPAARCQATEDEDGQIGEVRHHHQIGESRVRGVHDGDGSARTS
jgi:hypothetical protein